MVDLKTLAAGLVYLRLSPSREAIRILEEEFGIDIASLIQEDENQSLSAEDIVEELYRIKEERLKTDAVVTCRENALKKQKPYAPRKIGNPRGFPPNMRRRK